MGRGGSSIYKRAKRGRSKRSGDDDDDDGDEEFVLGEEEEEEDEEESSYESYPSSREESEEEFEFTESSSSDESEEAARSKPRRRRIEKRRVWDDDEDDEEEEEDDDDEFLGRRKRSRGGARRRRRSKDSDEGDEDFSPDEVEDDDDEISLDSGRRSFAGRKVAPRRGGKKRKGRASKEKKKRTKRTVGEPAKKRRRRSVRRSDEEDDDFIVRDRVEAGKRGNKSKKVKRKKKSAPRTRKRRSSETSDFDYGTSDDDFVVKDRIVVNRRRAKSKNAEKRRLAPRGRKKRSETDLESSDFDYVISEEEVRDLTEGTLSWQQPKRVFMDKNGKEKGKEKVTDDSRKQVCGICLSDERKGTIQGVLNSCAHYFCFACIMEWSKVESRCPVCKRRFVTITKCSRSDPGVGLRKAVIRVQKRDQVYQPSEEEVRSVLDPYENVVCMECQRGGDDDLMILCDICDSSAHTYCVGLGRDVPEGNWYCEGCRSAEDGFSYLQVQDTFTDQGANGSDFLDVGIKTKEATHIHVNTAPRRSFSSPAQSTSHRFDLNVSPRNFPEEDYGVASQASRGGASTLSGRRAIQHHIRILLSNSRLRQISPRSNMTPRTVERDFVTSEMGQSGETLHVSEDLNSLHEGTCTEKHQQNSRPFYHFLSPRMSGDRSSFFRHVEGAKEQVQSMVKSHLENLTREFPLEVGRFKQIARHSTHTILAACGLEHRQSMVLTPIHPPSSCSHGLDVDKPEYLIKDCCPSCFSSFVEDVVQRVIGRVS